MGIVPPHFCSFGTADSVEQLTTTFLVHAVISICDLLRPNRSILLVVSLEDLLIGRGWKGWLLRQAPIEDWSKGAAAITERYWPAVAQGKKWQSKHGEEKS